MKAFGYAERAAAVAKVREAVTDKNSPQTSSMYRDMMQEYPIEADQIVGDLVERATRVGSAYRICRPLIHICVFIRRTT
ncbi:ketopantoate reductase family protein [Rahnella variigena]|uniref:ketopantoate reductase family protein n=1 Tax=Rahnella variigena TaxID=574964 RepID=UPI001FC958B4|nr:ketopantoate reductase C-terminal domain-containing protein [Rahnella variigena]